MILDLKIFKIILYEHRQLCLEHICNLSFTTGIVPSELKVAKVIPASKKCDKSKPDNYRPISLLSVFDKLLEKLMYNRLYNFLQKHDILYRYQFGFGRCHFTSLALIEGFLG